MAVFGSFVPLGIGFGLAQAVGLDWRESLVVGTVLAPTSVGIALNVLKAGKVGARVRECAVVKAREHSLSCKQVFVAAIMSSCLHCVLMCTDALLCMTFYLALLSCRCMLMPRLLLAGAAYTNRTACHCGGHSGRHYCPDSSQRGDLVSPLCRKC